MRVRLASELFIYSKFLKIDRIKTAAWKSELFKSRLTRLVVGIRGSRYSATPVR